MHNLLMINKIKKLNQWKSIDVETYRKINSVNGFYGAAKLDDVNRVISKGKENKTAII